jgi:hypothetical protein
VLADVLREAERGHMMSQELMAEARTLRRLADRARRVEEVERAEAIAADRAMVLAYARGMDPHARKDRDPALSFRKPMRWWT